MRAWCALVMGCLAGCFSGPQSVHLSAPPGRLPSAAQVTSPVRFHVTDERRFPGEVGWTGLGRWSSSEPIRSDASVPRWLEKRLEGEATARHWPLTADGAPIHVSIIEVYNRFYPGGWAPTGESTVALLARVDDCDGFVRYGRYIEVVKIERGVPAWPETAGELVSKAMAAAVSELLDDPALHASLQGGANGCAQPL
jgi:hypothetical protein